MEKHDLRHEFPEYEAKIHELKISDMHFKKLFDEYHEINNEIHMHYTQPKSNPENVAWRSITWDLFASLVKEIK